MAFPFHVLMALCLLLFANTTLVPTSTVYCGVAGGATEVAPCFVGTVYVGVWETS